MLYVIWSTTFDGVSKFGPYLPEEAAVQEFHLCEIARNQHGMALSGTPGEMWDFTKGKEWTGCVFTYDDSPDKALYSKDNEAKYKAGKEWSAKKATEHAQESKEDIEKELYERGHPPPVAKNRSAIASQAAYKAWKTIRAKKAKNNNPQAVILPQPTDSELHNARECSILPCGKLDTQSGSSQYFNMSDKDAENSSLIVAKDPRDGTIRVICGSGDGASYLKTYPTLQKLIHDQTGKRLGYGKFIEHTTTADFSNLQKYGRKLKFYVFK